MKEYIGVKLIQAKPMTRGEHSVSKGYDKVLEGSADDVGYQTIYPDGYESWSPLAAFEEAYRPTEGMTFGLAIEAMKKGYKVAREGWNGKGMFLFLVPGSNFKVNRPPLLGIYHEGKDISYQPHIDMKTAQDTVVPWLASQSDMLADDWQVV